MSSNKEKICHFCWYREKDVHNLFKYAPSVYTFDHFWYGKVPDSTIDELFECRAEVWGSWNNWTEPLIAKECDSYCFENSNGCKYYKDRNFHTSIKLKKGVYEYKWKFIHRNFTYWLVDPKRKKINNDCWNENNLYIYM
jgi:hypothetical protein